MSTTLRDFESGVVHNRQFHHCDHVRVAFELVGRDPFDVALARFMSGLRGIAIAAGQPTKVHMTITVAFLAAIAEHRAHDPVATWDEFVARNPELVDKAFLRRWYTSEELNSDLARRTFLLPRPLVSSPSLDMGLR